MRSITRWGCLVALAVWGCGAELRGEVVATVGERAISAADLAEGARKIYGAPVDAAHLDGEKRKKVLDGLIAAELLELEGEKRGLDQTPGIRLELEALERRLLAEEYFARQVWAGIEVREEEIRARYEEWGAGDQRHLAHILCASETEAGEVLAELAQGRDFAELARTRSRHADSMPHGGDMGFLRRGMVLPEIAAAIWNAETGQVHPQPIHTCLGYHVVKVLDRRRQGLEEQRANLQQRLETEKKLARQQTTWVQLQARYRLRWNPEVAARMARREELPADQILFSWQGGQLMAADYLRRAQVPQPVFSDSAQIHRLAERLVMEDLASLEARALGYGALEGIRKQLDHRKRELLGQRLFELETAEGEDAAQRIRAFYEQHRDRYQGRALSEVQEAVRRDLATLRMDAFIDSLRQRYKDEIKISEPRPEP